MNEPGFIFVYIKFPKYQLQDDIQPKMKSTNEDFSLCRLKRETNLRKPDTKPHRQPHTPNKAKVSKGKYSNPKPVTS